ncbi:tether containing UBX domain for GLUT4-like [Sycon ciliatum]|uniref:tether containing UBX domain for GLUT4-like n=1 Tax=Sycon ciliatum TaxID=27933 RepID=UPI0020AAB514|eukprot:scpid45540/ scgid16567/ Tether containing UBX domain for GLUT4; Alveolar soft part sarcoma chromosomal region candidate gene 1 protein; Alveolar soft part sarcoma locus; Renal papillary cell carcinoma protein 17; UBX domain-containing protein 9
MSSVNVLCPGGKRFVVKVTPNKKMLEILEDVCKRMDLNPSQHQLVHGRKNLDLSMSFRLSGLPNKAHLELVAGVGVKADSKVGVALQIPTGERLQKEWQATDTLWSVLEYWRQNNSALQQETGMPVCVYLQQEVAGEVALKRTTLRSLGLTGGRALVRVHFKSEAPVAAAASVSVEASTVAVPSGQQSHAASSHEAASRQNQAAGNLPAEGSVSSSGRTIGGEMPSSVVDLAVLEPAALSAQDSSSVGEQHQTAVDRPASSATQPVDSVAEAHAATTTTAAAATEPSAAVSTTEETMDTSASQPSAPAPAIPLSHPTSAESAAESSTVPGGCATAAAAAHTESIPHSTTADSSQQVASAPRKSGLSAKLQSTHKDNTFGGTSFGERTVDWSKSVGHRLGGPSTTDAGPPPSKRPHRGNQTEGEATPRLIELSGPIERHAVLFEPKTAQDGRAGRDDLPDDFFDLRAEDLRLMLKDLRAIQQGDADKPLATKEMRQREEEKRLVAYRQGVIRVQFPERLVLQGVFQAGEPVQAVMDFVKGYLEDSTLDFHLYVSPPKQVLQPLYTLAEAKLMPAAKLFFGSSVSRDRYVRQDVLQRSTSLAEAEEITAKCFPARSDSTAGDSVADEASASAAAQSSSNEKEETKPAKSLTPQEQSKKAAALPKWFSLGKK